MHLQGGGYFADIVPFLTKSCNLFQTFPIHSAAVKIILSKSSCFCLPYTALCASNPLPVIGACNTLQDQAHKKQHSVATGYVHVLKHDCCLGASPLPPWKTIWLNKKKKDLRQKLWHSYLKIWAISNEWNAQTQVCSLKFSWIILGSRIARIGFFT